MPQSCPDEERVLPYSGNVRHLYEDYRSLHLGLWYDSNVRHLYEDWHKFAGDRVPKNCRSSTGSQMVEAGTPTVVVKDFLGHSSVVITEKHYVNTSGALRKAEEDRKAAG